MLWRRRLATAIIAVVTMNVAAVSLDRDFFAGEVDGAVAATVVPNVQAAVLRNWGPVVAGDEFNYLGPPDPLKWKVYDSVGHDGNGLRSPKAVKVASGALFITGDSQGTTGGVSAKFAQQKYGRWETRMRTTVRDVEYHPVVLLWPNNNDSPNCAEVDYAEALGNQNVVKFSLHYACTRSNFQTRAARNIDLTQWHNYAVEWTRTGITGYIDGVPWFIDTTPSHLPTVGMHQTLQLDWFPDGTVLNQTQMIVDWIRVYR